MKYIDEFIVVYLPYIVVAIDIFYHWLLSKGDLRKAYKVSIVMFIGFMLVETGLALRNPDQFHIIVFNVVNAWSIAMAIKGLKRLKREEQILLSGVDGR